jgi:hypothetical protein
MGQARSPEAMDHSLRLGQTQSGLNYIGQFMAHLLIGVKRRGHDNAMS